MKRFVVPEPGLLISGLVVLMTLIPIGKVIFYALHGSEYYITLFYDDFYYYLLVAKNIVQNGASSFDGISSTNGYHPLWMGILCLLVWACRGTGPFFFVALFLVCGALNWLTARRFSQLGSLLFPTSALVPAVTLVATVSAARLTFFAMESAIAIPLLADFIYRLALLPNEAPSPRVARHLGFLASLVILARLDVVMLVGILLVVFLTFCPSNLITKIRAIGSFCLGGLLLPVYLCSNLVLFRHVGTVSAASKQLKMAHGFTQHPISALIASENGMTLAYCAAIVLGIGAILVPWVRMRAFQAPRHALLVGATLVFPLVYYAVYCYYSDWSLFFYYRYPIPLAAFLAILLLSQLVLLRVPRIFATALRRSGLAVAAAYGMLFIAYRMVPGYPEAPTFYEVGRRLQSFALDHPGVYAMGNAAGIPSYLLHEVRRPVFQTEGIISDFALVDSIRKNEDLIRVLAHYGVDYYVVSGPPKERGLELHDTCYWAREPAESQCGSHSSYLRSTLCGAPVLHFETSGTLTDVFAVPNPGTPLESSAAVQSIPSQG
jgi:hypothetical protein